MSEEAILVLLYIVLYTVYRCDALPVPRKAAGQYGVAGCGDINTTTTHHSTDYSTYT